MLPQPHVQWNPWDPMKWLETVAKAVYKIGQTQISNENSQVVFIDIQTLFKGNFGEEWPSIVFSLSLSVAWFT